MQAYASRTGTARNIKALREAGWRWIIGPLDHGGRQTFGMGWALDNGAWPAFEQGMPWNERAFECVLDVHGEGADFVVVPDVVADREASLIRTRQWLPRLMARRELRGSMILIAVQDGMTHDEIAQLADNDPRIGIFIGGSTEWKLSAIMPWGRWAKDRGLYVHVGRVNSSKRIALCAQAGADSFDGTSVTRYASNLARLDGARRQRALL